MWMYYFDIESNMHFKIVHDLMMMAIFSIFFAFALLAARRINLSFHYTQYAYVHTCLLHSRMCTRPPPYQNRKHFFAISFICGKFKIRKLQRSALSRNVMCTKFVSLRLIRDI